MSLVESLQRVGVEPGQPLGLALHPDIGLGVATGKDRFALGTPTPLDAVAEANENLHPRWIWWDKVTARLIAEAGVPIDRCWDVITVHRLLHGGWRTSIALAWAWLHGLSPDSVPQMGQLGLLDGFADEGSNPDNPVRPDRHLRPEWVDGGWQQSPERMSRWAEVALSAASLQRVLLADRPFPDKALSTAHSESVAELLSAELEVHGLPVDESEAQRIIAEAVGPRPASFEDEEASRARRDSEVFRHLDPPHNINLRSPTDVKAMLRRVGLDLPDTRAWRLEQARGAHPVVEALLTWRKRERIATTYGYRWLDENIANARLRGSWSSTDGAAGRMTASAGLHNLPADMRPAICASSGHVFVRADLGQIEPRVLAAVSGDPALVAATQDDDLYQPVAKRLGVERSVAKVAVLGAMYGATTGESANALRGLEKAYPTAMGLLARTAAEGSAGNDVMTVGGRRVRMWTDTSTVGDIDRARAVAAARGRFARNAVIQGAAAEFFKVWAVIVRRRIRPIRGQIALCLHDELLVHVNEDHAETAAEIVARAIDEAAHYWSPEPDVRFLADTCLVQRWSDAKH